MYIGRNDGPLHVSLLSASAPEQRLSTWTYHSETQWLSLRATQTEVSEGRYVRSLDSRLTHSTASKSMSRSRSI